MDATPLRPGANPFALDPDELRPWSQLEKQALSCTRCALHESRTKVVFGDGNPDADLMIIGEGPGRHEDLQGRPFAGASGNVLDNMLAEAGLNRDDCYIANVIKCRPPGQRDPEREEIESCMPYLLEQMAHVRPRVIVTLGSFATRLVLRRSVPIAKIAGYRFEVFGGTILVPTFHPAAALRGHPQAVVALRRDLRTAKAVLDGRLAGGALASGAGA